MPLLARGSSSHEQEGEQKHNAKNLAEVREEWALDGQEGDDVDAVDGYADPEDDGHQWHSETTRCFWYVMFLLVFCTLVFGPRNADAHFQMRTMENLFVYNEYAPGNSFSTIGDRETFWDFLNYTFIPNVFPIVDYTGEPLSRTKQLYLPDGANYRLGNPRLRFIRLKNDLCSLPSDVNKVAEQFGEDNAECFPTYYRAGLDGSGNEDQDPYFPGRDVDPNSNFKLEWEVTDQPQYRSPFTKITYSGNGYVVDLAEQTGNQTLTTGEMNKLALQSLRDLRDNFAVDDATRAVFVELNVYNPNVDVFTAIRLCIEFTASGAVGATSKVASAPLLTNLRTLTNDGIYGTSVLLLYLEFIFFLAVIYQLVQMTRAIREHRNAGKPFFRGWHLIDATSLGLLFVVFFMRLYALRDVASLDFLEPRFYPEVQQQITLARTVDELNGLNAIFLFFRLLKFTERNLHLGQLTRTMEKCAAEFLAFFFVAGAIVIGFGIAFHLAFGSVERGYMDLSFSLQTLLRCILGDFDISRMFDANPLLALFFFASFIVVTFFVLLSMILAMVDGAYENVRVEIAQLKASGYVDPLTRDLVYLYYRPGVKFKRLLHQVVLWFYRIEGKMMPRGAHGLVGDSAAQQGGKVVDEHKLEEDVQAEELAAPQQLLAGSDLGSEVGAEDPSELVDAQYLRYKQEYDVLIKATRDLKSTQKDLERALKTINARIGSASNFIHEELVIPDSDDEEEM